MTQQAATNESVFSAQASAATPPAAEEAKGIYGDLVGEGKKYKDNEALAKSKLEADAFIERLKSEQEELRKELQKKLDAEQLLEDLKKSIHAGNQPPTSQPQSAPVPNKEELGKLVDERLQEAETQRVYNKNVAEADKYITTKFGGKAEATKFIDSKAEEFGVSKSWLMDMAGRNPNALYKLLGVEQQQMNTTTNQPIVPKSTVSMERTPPSGNKTKPYYEEIRRTNPSLYFSSKIQNEIFKASQNGTYE